MKSRRGTPWLAGLLLLGLGALVARWALPRGAAPPSPSSRSSPSAVSPGLLLEVAPGVFRQSEPGPSFVYIVRGKTGCVIVDTGARDDGQVILDSLAFLQIPPAEVQAILLTHAHVDHTAGAEALRRATGAQVQAGAGDCQVLRAGAPREAFISIFEMPGQQLHPTTIDVELQGGEEIDLGDGRLHVMATPGHTPGSVCVWLERDERRYLFSGDTIMSADALGLYPAYLPPVYRGDAEQFLQTLRRLQGEPAPFRVLPAHSDLLDDGRVMPPPIDSRWADLLFRGIHELETLVVRLRQDGADFLDGQPKTIEPGLDYLGDFAGRASYRWSTPAGDVLFNPAGGAALAEQLADEPGADQRPLRWGVLLDGGPEQLAGALALAEQIELTWIVDPQLIPQLHARRPDLAAVSVTELMNAAEEAEPSTEDARRLPAGLQAIPLGVRDPGDCIFRLDCGGKQVVVTPRFPLRLHHDASLAIAEQVQAELRGALQQRTAEPARVIAALETLQALAPRIWLPAQPVRGQNANIYDGEWRTVIDENRALVVGRSPTADR